MSSQVRFEPQGVEGLVASGTTVAAAAERLGVPIELACGGVGECTSCAVRMVENPFALSEVTEDERRQLGDERLAAGVRLGCRAVVREGDCTIRVLGVKAGGEKGDDDTPGEGPRERIFQEFARMPATDQLMTALELQIKVAGELLGSLADLPLKAGEELYASIFGRPAEDESKTASETAPEGTEKTDGSAADDPAGAEPGETKHE